MGQRVGHPLTEVDMNAVKYLKTIGMPMEDIMGVSRHLWLEPPVLRHWATTAGRPPTLTILYIYCI